MLRYGYPHCCRQDGAGPVRPQDRDHDSRSERASVPDDLDDVATKMEELVSLRAGCAQNVPTGPSLRGEIRPEPACSLVEPPGIEPDALPGILGSELQVRSVSIPLSTSRYLRLCFRVLTVSMLTIYRPGSQDSSDRSGS